MREIKFRAWDKENKFMVPVLYFDEYDVVMASDDQYGDRFRIGEMPIERSVVMQFTGLKDKNGKEIYEGDILDVVVLGGIERYEVKWVGTGFFLTDGWGPWCPSSAQCTLLGNIYENPELLKP
jgi:uncharacterized phage protein (TIGR01671 family)